MDTGEFLKSLPFIEDNFDEIFRAPEAGIVYTQMEILFKILHELKKINSRLEDLEAISWSDAIRIVGEEFEKLERKVEDYATENGEAWRHGELP